MAMGGDLGTMVKRSKHNSGWCGVGALHALNLIINNIINQSLKILK